MPTTTFKVDEKVDATLEELKLHYGASSKAEIFRKAVAALKLMMNSEQPDGTVVIRQGDQDVRFMVK